MKCCEDKASKNEKTNRFVLMHEPVRELARVARLRHQAMEGLPNNYCSGECSIMIEGNF